MGVWVPHGLATEEAAVIAGVASPEMSVVLHEVDVEHCGRVEAKMEKSDMSRPFSVSSKTEIVCVPSRKKRFRLK